VDRPKITNTATLSAILTSDHAMRNMIASRSSAVYNSNMSISATGRSLLSLFSLGTPLLQRLVRCTTRLPPRFQKNNIWHLFHEVSSSTANTVSPQAADAKPSSYLLTQPAPLTYLELAQTRFTGNDSIFTSPAARFDIVLRVWRVAYFRYFHRQ
jgi:hypothetical protein